ncbi:MAG: fumarylacetoacetate hydrolase family protein [Firmicutes bacterium]|nr:fumarylacetoacetate hydrolase family protein [Bacillota bacterium]
MRLVHFWREGRLLLGIRTDRGILDVAAARAALGIPGPETLAEAMAQGVGSLAVLAEAAAARPELGPGIFLDEADLRFGPCVPAPGKILCIGLNYRQHAAEAAMEVPAHPVVFGKYPNALAGHGEPIPIPPGVAQMDYEGELTLVIGRRARQVSREEALGYVFGYCIGNDISARDLQFRTSQWLLGKSCDGFAPIGPYLVTADEVPDPQALELRTYVNGELRQEAWTGAMIFDCAYLVHYLSQYMTLEPGDLIMTGTPAGVALGRPERPWLRPGDEVAVEITGLGRLCNRIVG